MAGSDQDEPLVEACRSGHPQAFGELVRRYQDRLYPTLLRLTGSPEDAQDLLQDSFLRAYQKLDHFQGGSSFYTWLYRLSVNLALSGRRRRKGKVAVRWSDLGPDGPGEPADDASNAPTLPLEIAEREAIIQQALDTLSPEHRAVVVLKEFDGLRYEDVAEALEIPIGTVRSRLHRARLELREKLRSLVEPSRSPAPGPKPVER